MKTITKLSEVAGRHNYLMVDFFAEWCGPCKRFAPIYETYPTKYPHVEFVKSDVDAAEDFSREFSVSAMPTFVLFRKKGHGWEEVNRVRGANQSAIEALISSVH